MPVSCGRQRHQVVFNLGVHIGCSALYDALPISEGVRHLMSNNSCRTTSGTAPRLFIFATLVLAGVGCADQPTVATAQKKPETAAAPQRLGVQPARGLDWRNLPAPDHTLENFRPGETPEYCFDRATQPYTAVVDTHFHPKPFGGPAMDAQEIWAAFDRLGVRFVNYFGIGQVLELDANCSYYLDCPGVAAIPSIKNDFVNGLEKAAYDPDTLHITLSMTFIDLAHAERAAEMIALYDEEFPDMFTWSGELNVMKQALLGNQAEPASLESIAEWAEFMAIFRERGIPVTLHSDLGNDAEPTQFLYLMDHVLASYPDNKIVWAHMGLSKELTTMDAREHVRIMSERLDQYPHLYLDISWDVIYNAYHQWGEVFIPFFNEYSTRLLPGSDFVAAASKTWQTYAHELEVTSRPLRVLDDQAFRNIALGQNYFDLMELPYEAPVLCER